MIRSHALLQREHGIAGTALPQVIEHSGTPRGSIYHHFPNGRAELAGAATRFAADWVAQNLEQALASEDLLAAHESFINSWLVVLRDSDFRAGCAVAAGALDVTPESAATQSAADGFHRWENLLREALERAGVAPARAQTLAVTSIASIEGALVMSRAQASTRPLEQVGAQLQMLLAQEIGARDTPEILEPR